MSSPDDRRLLDRIVARYPPRKYRLDDYKRWFPETASAMVQYLKGFSPLRDPSLVRALESDAPAIGVVVVPWVSTPVPWYSIMLAIGLAKRGRRVVLLWDDTGFPEQRLAQQQRAVAAVLKLVREVLPLVRLSELEPATARPGDEALVALLARHNLIWRVRGALPTPRDEQIGEKIRASLAASLPYVRTALSDPHLDCVVVPGGVYGTSGLFRSVAQERSCRLATFDVDWGIAQICVSGVASQSADVPRAFDALWDSAPAVREQVIEIARSEFAHRTESDDTYGFQVVPSDGDFAGDDIAALIPMNVEWDSAALGRFQHFTDTIDWITATTEVILAESTGTVVVRQHPSERRPHQRGKLDVRSALHERFSGDPRVRFIAADEQVNTYDLARSARIVLPYVSTIGIEAAAIGKPVLASGSCYYVDLGIVWSAGSRDEYFELLRRGLRGDLPLRPDQVARAWTCYYLTAVQNRVRTEFTAHPDDFWKWCRRAPQSLFAEPEVSDILEAIDCDVPVSLLRHRRQFAEVGA